MRRWKNWLLPLLTCLTVGVLALLPGRLSRWRDEGLLGAVRLEDLGENSSFPAKAPELPERVRLLGRWACPPEELAAILQELEGEALEALAVRAWQALEALEAAGVLPQGVLPSFTRFSGHELYLRDAVSLSSAGFLSLSAYDGSTGQYLSLHLDLETGRILALELVSDALLKAPQETEAMGRAFLEGLGLECALMGTTGEESLFCLEDGETLYWVRRIRDGLDILPQARNLSKEPEDSGPETDFVIVSKLDKQP